MKYGLSPKEIPREKLEGFSKGLRQYFIVYPDSSHNTDILNCQSGIYLPGRSILVQLILCIAPTAW